MPETFDLEDVEKTAKRMADPAEEKQEAKRKAAPKTTAPKQVALKQIREKASGVFSIVGMATFARDPICGTAILEGQDKIVDALVNLADQNPYILKALEGGAMASGYLELAFAVAGVAVPVAMHHGRMPWNPELLEFIGQKAVAEQVRATSQPTDESVERERSDIGFGDKQPESASA